MKTIDIKFNNDFREVFKAGQEIHIPMTLLGITYLVGTNGCGKSTLLRAIRNTNDSMESKLRSDFDGCRNTKLSSVAKGMKDGTIEVSGLDQYTHIFALDAEADSGTDVLNASSAYGFIAGGGHAAQFMSRGQTTANQLFRFVKYFEECAKKAAEAKEKFRPLVIIDEVDEGLDIRMQVKWNEILSYRFNHLLADVLVVSHNPICMLSESPRVQAFDITTGTTTTVKEYIKNLTGVTVDLNYNK